MNLRVLTIILLAFLIFTSRMGYLKVKDNFDFHPEIKAQYFLIILLNSVIVPVVITKLIFQIPYELLSTNYLQFYGMCVTLTAGLVIQVWAIGIFSNYLKKKGEKIKEEDEGKFISRFFSFIQIFGGLSIISYFYT